MKRIFTLVFILATAFYAEKSMAQLVSGDIAVIAINTDDPDAFQGATLKDIPANSVITFTDNAWIEASSSFTTNEGYITWTTPNSVITKGSVFTFTGTTITPNSGMAVATGSPAFAATGDQIIAFLGTVANRPTSSADPRFLWAISTNNFTYNSNTNTSDLPSALALPEYFVSFTGTTTDIDNGYFANGNMPTNTISVSGNKDELVSLFNDRTKYYTNNTGPLTFPTVAVILPVKLLSFTASAKNNSSTIFNWKTATETNTSRFEIEQSVNGKDFTTLATVAAAGTSMVEKSYSYTGNLNVATTYYRLKMIDADGKFSTSAIVKITASKSGFALGNVYPVPAKNSVTVEWNSNRTGATSITVTDMSGRTIRTTNVQAAAGFNQFVLDVQSLNAGQYFIRLKNEAGQVQTVITKQ